jgi:hypothetical protein
MFAASGTMDAIVVTNEALRISPISSISDAMAFRILMSSSLFIQDMVPEEIYLE